MFKKLKPTLYILSAAIILMILSAFFKIIDLPVGSIIFSIIAMVAIFVAVLFSIVTIVNVFLNK